MEPIESRTPSPTTRRNFLAAAVGLPVLAAAQKRVKIKIRDLQTMVLQGQRTYTLVKVVADDGSYGIGEAYGSPGVGVKEQVLSLKPWLLNKDPLEIDTLYTQMGEHTPNLSGTRTDGSAHALMRAVSGMEMALWDLAGKALRVPTVTLLGGRFRDRVRVYDHAAPRNMLDKASCREWAQKVKSDPSGFTAHKFAFPHTDPRSDPARDRSNRVLTTTELTRIRRGFENCRAAIGWDHDLMVHCHWEYDLRTSIQLAEAVESIRPLWLEDPLPPEYTESWKRLVAAAKVPICTGENLAEARFQGLHHQPGMRYPPSRLAEHGGLPGNQADRRLRRGLLAANGHPQHGQRHRHDGHSPLGQYHPRLPGVRDHRGPPRLDGRRHHPRRTCHPGRVCDPL